MARLEVTSKADRERAKTLREAAGGAGLDCLRDEYRSAALEAEDARHALNAAPPALPPPRRRRRREREAAARAPPPEPSDEALERLFRATRTYGGDDAMPEMLAPPPPGSYDAGGRVRDALDAARSTLGAEAAASPRRRRRRRRDPKPVVKQRSTAVIARPAPRGPPLDVAHLNKVPVSRASEADACEVFHRFLVDCSIAGDWRKALEAYRLMVSRARADS